MRILPFVCILLVLQKTALASSEIDLKKELSEAGTIKRFEKALRNPDAYTFPSSINIETNADNTINLSLSFLKISDLRFLKKLPISSLDINYTQVSNLSPLRKLPLKKLELRETKVTDLSPLHGLPLEELEFSETEVSDLSPLKGMPLKKLELSSTQVKDLSALADLPLDYLDICFNPQITDLTPLSNTSLTFFRMMGTGVSDLSPLKNLPIEKLLADESPIEDLSPLANLPITDLLIRDTKVKDLSPLTNVPLKRLEFTESMITNGLKELQAAKLDAFINGASADEFWEMQKMDKLGDEYYASLEVIPDSQLAKDTQKCVTRMKEMASRDMPESMGKSLHGIITIDEISEVLSTNLQHTTKIGKYIGLEIKHDKISPSDTDMSQSIVILSNKTLIIDTDLLSRKTYPVDEAALNANEYLKVLPNLHIAEGYTLDYLYWADGMGNGSPKLYARRVNAPRIHCPYLLMFLLKESEIRQDAYIDCLNALRTDGSPEGYVQLAVFDHLSDQFYLAWHAGYMDSPLISSHAAMREFVADPSNFMIRKSNMDHYSLPIKMAAKAMDIDPTPIVIINDDTVSVRLASFSNWKGFYSRTVTFSKQPPHQILDEKRKVLVEYNCGIVY